MARAGDCRSVVKLLQPARREFPNRPYHRLACARGPWEVVLVPDSPTHRRVRWRTMSCVWRENVRNCTFLKISSLRQLIVASLLSKSHARTKQFTGTLFHRVTDSPRLTASRGRRPLQKVKIVIALTNLGERGALVFCKYGDFRGARMPQESTWIYGWGCGSTVRRVFSRSWASNPSLTK